MYQGIRCAAFLPSCIISRSENTTSGTLYDTIWAKAPLRLSVSRCTCLFSETAGLSCEEDFVVVILYFYLYFELMVSFELCEQLFMYRTVGVWRWPNTDSVGRLVVRIFEIRAPTSRASFVHARCAEHDWFGNSRSSRHGRPEAVHHSERTPCLPPDSPNAFLCHDRRGPRGLSPPLHPGSRTPSLWSVAVSSHSNGCR